MSERDAYHHMSIEQNGRFDSTTPEPQQSPHHEQEARPSDMEIYHDLLQILEEVAPDESDLVHPFQVASLVPPITHESLGELDIARIINNPKLRHDVNFDRELHFRPNTDGSRGKIKQQTSRDYWDALTAELILYNQVGARLLQCDNLLGQEQFVRMMEMAQKRMPGILETVKEVLKSLVPERDQARVNDRLDIPVIMQQISKGVFDLMDLAQWLSKLLKDHCAPMRDEWIDRMVEMTQQGVVEGSPHGIVEGMRELLSILESMKLDVANHQIRHLRALLIEDTVNFQQRYHIHRMTYGRLDVTRSRMWFAMEELQLQQPIATPDHLRVFTLALLRGLLSQSSLSSFPETFQLDGERLRSMRNDLHNIVYLDICCDVLTDLAGNRLSAASLSSARTSLRSALADIVGDVRKFADSIGNIAVEIVRLLLLHEHAGKLYDPDLVAHAEDRLRVDLQTSSRAFSTHASKLIETQSLKLYNWVKASLRLSIMQLHEAMMPPISPPPSFVGLINTHGSTGADKAIEDVFRRITHVATLHWHIWAPIVYLVPQEEVQSSAQSVSGDSDSGSDGAFALRQAGAPSPSPSPSPEAQGQVPESGPGEPELQHR